MQQVLFQRTMIQNSLKRQLTQTEFQIPIRVFRDMKKEDAHNCPWAETGAKTCQRNSSTSFQVQELLLQVAVVCQYIPFI